MAKSLVIVESPAKARTITRYLGRDYTVKASLGHVKDLPRRRLGVDVDNDFRPTYFIIRGKEKAKSSRAKATKGRRKKDSDESSVLKTAPPVGKGKKIYRVAMNEITPRGVRQAFANPAEIDSHLVDAQQARRILDRLPGPEVSPP